MSLKVQELCLLYLSIYISMHHNKEMFVEWVMHERTNHRNHRKRKDEEEPTQMLPLTFSLLWLKSLNLIVKTWFMFQWFYYWKVSLGSYVLKGLSNKITALLHDVKEFFQLSQVPCYSGYSITLTIQMSIPPHFATFLYWVSMPCQTSDQKCRPKDRAGTLPGKSTLKVFCVLTVEFNY